MDELQLVILKPDCIARCLTEVILSRIVEGGLKVVYSAEILLTEDCVMAIYGDYTDKPFYSEMVAYLTSAPSRLLVVAGPGAYQTMKRIKGNTYEGYGVRGECARKDDAGNFLDGQMLEGKWYVFKNIFHVADEGVTGQEFLCITGKDIHDVVLL